MPNASLGIPFLNFKSKLSKEERIMKKTSLILIAAALLMVLPACGKAEPALADGVYTAKFDTDSSMFAVNETCDGRGTLTVENGEMTIHVTLRSTHIVNLFPGTAEDAQKDGAVLLQPTEDEVTYSDGLTETVYGFDVPVPVLDQEFDLALIGTKSVWYDHKVSVSDPQPLEDSEDANNASSSAQTADATTSSATDSTSSAAEPEDGTYTCDVALEGGSGRATVESPAKLTIADGKITATIVWSSSNYDYMKVGDVQYQPVNTEGNSTFEIPVSALDVPQDVIADTVAMSEPHEIEYTLTFDSATLQSAE